MDDEQRKVAATCRVCGQQLTVQEFRECAGMGHHCKAHLPSGATRAPAAPRTTRIRSSPSRRAAKVSSTGAAEYSCKGQFARDGVIRRGKLTSDHPASINGALVFVCNDVGYGPGEIVTLFVKDAHGREHARRCGFECHD